MWCTLQVHVRIPGFSDQETNTQIYPKKHVDKLHVVSFIGIGTEVHVASLLVWSTPQSQFDLAAVQPRQLSHRNMGSIVL